MLASEAAEMCAKIVESWTDEAAIPAVAEEIRSFAADLRAKEEIHDLNSLRLLAQMVEHNAKTVHQSLCNMMGINAP